MGLFVRYTGQVENGLLGNLIGWANRKLVILTKLASPVESSVAIMKWKVMKAHNDSILDQADGLIRSGRGGEAVQGLMGYLHRNPQSEDGWFLLSQAVSDMRQKEDCLKQVLKINPGRSDARDRLHLVQDVTRSQGRKGSRQVAVTVSRGAWDPGVPQEWGDEGGLSGGLRTEKVKFLDQVKASIDRLTGIQRSQVKPWQASIPYALVAMAVGGCLFLSVVLGLIKYDERKVAWSATQTQAYRFILPPTWTPTPIPPPTETPTPQPTRTPTASPTFPAPGPTSAAAVSTIQAQVSELRRLSVAATPSVHLGERARIAGVMSAMLAEEVVFYDLETRSKTLHLLGLVPPDYDLEIYMANSLTDGLGGFFHPRRNEIYIAGRQLSSSERYTYAHEFTHALAAANFGVTDRLLNPICRFDFQRCKAYQSLLEGDALLVAQQWLNNKAGPEVYRQLINNLPAPGQFLPEADIPPALLEDLLFPYTHGQDFVKTLYSRGGWAEVDRAYLDPPETTEQILHPEKYFRGEGSLVVEPYSLEYDLGASWHLKDWSFLGEWMTYLLLAHGVDPGGRLEESAAASAAAGWGGDLFQLYMGAGPGEWVMVVQWVWDTPAAGVEFENALGRRLAGRIDARPLAGLPGSCWEASDRLDCVLIKGEAVVWAAAPDFDWMVRLLSLIP